MWGFRVIAPGIVSIILVPVDLVSSFVRVRGVTISILICWLSGNDLLGFYDRATSSAVIPAHGLGSLVGS
jgi:hypothetical protein